MRNPSAFGKRKPPTAGAPAARPHRRTILGVGTAVLAVLIILSALPDSKSAREANEPTSAPDQRMWVMTDRADRRTCPSTACGLVGRLFFREAADFLELKDGWARVSKYYDAACSDGRSGYVDEGNSACVKANGIVDGQFAEWVPVSSLSKIRPADPAEAAKGVAALVGGSDDFRIYQSAFVRAAQTLMSSGRCRESDLREMGGFLKSSNHRGAIYFTYCGAMTLENRIYLDAASGRIFK